MFLSTALTTSIGWTIWAGGVVLVGFSLHYHFRPTVKARLAYQWDGRIIAGKEKEDLPAEITAVLKELGYPYTSTTAFVIWNASDQGLRGSDIVGADPIRVELGPKDRFVSIHVQSQTNEANSIQVRTDPEHPNVAVISFDSLQPKEGVRVEMLHTGLGYMLTLKGSLRGLPNSVSNLGRVPICDETEKKKSSQWGWYYIANLCFLLVLYPVAVVHPWRRVHSFLLVGGSMELIGFASFVLTVYVGVATSLGGFRRRFGRYPKGLRTQA